MHKNLHMCIFLCTFATAKVLTTSASVRYIDKISIQLRTWVFENWTLSNNY